MVSDELQLLWMGRESETSMGGSQAEMLLTSSPLQATKIIDNLVEV